MIDRFDESLRETVDWLKRVIPARRDADDDDEPDADDDDEPDADDDDEPDADDDEPDADDDDGPDADDDGPDADDDTPAEIRNQSGSGPSSDGSSGENETRSDGGNPAADSSDGRANGEAETWQPAESPTSRTLHGVVHGQDGPYACGEGGLLLHRGADGWQILLERGPGVSENTLRSIAATDDGCRVWFAGDSGALGYYDVADGHLSDYSAPMEKTSTWESIAVTGRTGEERVRIANGSGEVLDCIMDDDDCPVWGEVVEPGGGSTIPGLTAGPDGFYAVDTSGGAYFEPRPDDPPGADAADRDPRHGKPADTEPTDTDPSDEWKRIGVRNAQVNFQDVWAGERSVFIAGADGIAYRYDPRCENWTPLAVGQGALQSIRSTRSNTIAVATGGRIYQRDDSVRWHELEAPTEQSLLGLALARSRADVDEGLATTPVDVAVGSGGVILERDRTKSSDSGGVKP
ncbi:hypothetical protein [Natrinema halophilum]|uniref:WD40 repeat domain-containing protein n=1 Tax=Natrinema halophilum TaxID=1699371 RepID=A0A7D5L3J6_9EURY|nr:hypothetical protein [Natrinema halophilum]QLG50365.1 hypothetical protein HYG82_16695 [Natrinema halophilum]